MASAKTVTKKESLSSTNNMKTEYYEDQVSEAKAWRKALPEDLRTMTPRTQEMHDTFAPEFTPEYCYQAMLDHAREIELELNTANGRIIELTTKTPPHECPQESVILLAANHPNLAEYIAQMERQIADGAKMLGMATDLNLDLQNKADMWRDEFERIKAICYGKSLEFLEIRGICERAMLDIRSKISLIDQREKVAEENIDLRRGLRVISDHYDILRAEMVENHAKVMHGMFQAAAMPKDMDYCRTMSNAKLRGKCLACDGTGSLANVGGAKDEDTGCPHCEGCGYVEIPDLSWLKNGKIQFNLLPKEHPDYDPT